MNDFDCAIVIAAGGEGSRIGGTKPFRKLAGQNLILHGIAWARSHSATLAVAVRRPVRELPSGIIQLPDRIPGLGPISALQSAFAFARERKIDTVLLIACDMPFLPHDLVERLMSALGEGYGAAIPESGGRWHPMAGLWRVDEDLLEAYLAGGGRSLWKFAKEVGAATVTWNSQPDPFANINDAAALAEAEARIRNSVQ